MHSKRKKKILKKITLISNSLSRFALIFTYKSLKTVFLKKMELLDNELKTYN